MSLLEPMFYAVFLQFIRTIAALRIAPLTLHGPLPMLPSVGLALALSLVTAPSGEPIPLPGGAALAAAVLFEVIVGIALGTGVGICLSVFRMAGALVSHSIFLNGHPGESSPAATFYSSLGLVVFVSAGGHHALFTALIASRHYAPPGILMAPSSDWLTAMVHLVTGSFAVGAMLAAPVFVAAAAADLLYIGGARFFGISPLDSSPFRSLAVQIVAIGVLWKVVSLGVDYLSVALVDLC